jgi:hypothetical protein
MELQIDLSKTQVEVVVLNYLYDKIQNCSNRHDLMNLVSVYFSLKIDIYFAEIWQSASSINPTSVIRVEINENIGKYWNGVDIIKQFIHRSPNYLPLQHIATQLNEDFYAFVLAVGKGEKTLETYETKISEVPNSVDSEHY